MTAALAEPEAKKAHVWARDEHDWYVEEVRASEALFAVERFNGSIWDPCCGQGNILKSARAAGYSALGTDLVLRTDAPFVQGGYDFLAGEHPPYALSTPNIVMNPPFFRAKGAEAFIRKALSIATGKVCAFVDIRFIAGSERANGIFAELPPHRIWIVTPRVSCPPGAVLANGGKATGGTADWCWLVWDMTAPPTQSPQLGWLRKERPNRNASPTEEGA